MPANANTESMEMSQQPTMAAQPQMTTEQPVSRKSLSGRADKLLGVSPHGLLGTLGDRLAPWHTRTLSVTVPPTP